MPESAAQEEFPEAQCLGELLFTYMKRWKKNIAQYIPHTDYKDTYGQLLKKCIRVALKLQDIGITQNDVISVCSLNNENCCIPFIASQFIGAKFASLHPYLSKENTIYLLKLVQPKMIFVSADAARFIDECSKSANVQLRIVVFGCSAEYAEFSEYLQVQKSEDTFKPKSIDAKETALIVFTSGTTGYPKGATFSHYTLVLLNSLPYPTTYPQVILSYATLYWISGISYVLKSVVWGAARVLCPEFDAAQTWQIVEKYKVTQLCLTPNLVKEIIESREKDSDASSLRLLIIIGDQVTLNLLEEVTATFPNSTVVNFYSQTEFGGGGFYPNVIRHEDVMKRSPRVFSCGMVAPNYDWKIVDPSTERILGPNEVGELRMKSNCIMDGYYKMDHSSVFDDEGYIKTGDLFYYDEDNFMYLKSRLKSVFKYRAWHVSPVVIEEVLMSHPAVEDALVVGIPDDTNGNLPKGFVKLRNGYGDITPKDIEAFASRKLADHEKLRAGVEFVRDIPYTVTGKKKRSIFI